MKKLAVILAIVLAATTNIFAQGPSLKMAVINNNEEAHSVSINIPEVALLDLEGSSSITLAPTAPTEAGNAFDFSSATDNSIWVNYSSIVASGNSRSVTAQITSGSVPTGLNLKVAAGGFSGNGKGTTGSPATEITLSSSTQEVITGIGSSYTGNGASNGHNLTYALELNSTDDYDELVQGSTSVTVTYTLTDDN